MREKTELRIILIFTIAYLLFFTILSLVNSNYEFLYYTVIMSILIGMIVFYYQKIRLTPHILIGLTILGALHVFGGNIHLWNIRLYDLYLIPNIFRYDNLVHSFGLFVVTFVVYNILHPHLDKKIKHHLFIFALLLVTIAMGLGAVNEIFEFGAVILFDASQQVGDYFNNAIDLIFNLLGAIIASIFIVRYHKTKNHIKK